MQSLTKTDLFSVAAGGANVWWVGPVVVFSDSDWIIPVAVPCIQLCAGGTYLAAVTDCSCFTVSESSL